MRLDRTKEWWLKKAALEGDAPISVGGHRMTRIWPYTRYEWGWQIGIFGWWLVWSRCEGGRKLYVSNDATPPCRANKGLILWRPS